MALKPPSATQVEAGGAPEENAAWCAYEPVGQFKEAMSFAKFSGNLRHAFISGYRAALAPQTPTEPSEGEMR
jgi:hypothetical protein